MKQQEWVNKKSQARPIIDDDVRNARQEQESYWETVTEWEAKTTYVDGQPQTSQEPVSRPELRTRTVWKYEELDWLPGRTVTASGTSQADVHWPSYTLGKGSALASSTRCMSPCSKCHTVILVRASQARRGRQS